MKFPVGFFFGVATADHQCEAYNGDDDVRDVWERENGQTLRGRATDFWARYHEDVELAKGLGCSAFRLSLSWARLEPQPNAWDQAAFEHYKEVLTCIKDAGMQTIVTLHHNTWPLHIQAEEGGAGLLASTFPTRFAAYAEQVAKRLGEYIDYWLTLNEPNQLVFGYVKDGRSFPMPPGLEDASDANQAKAILQLIPSLFRAHSAAYDAIKSVSHQARIGTNPLVLGLPTWFCRWAERRLERATSETIRKHVRRIARRHRSASAAGKVDISIAQLGVTQSRTRDVLFSESYFVAHPSLLYKPDKAPPSSTFDCAARIAVASDVGAERARAIFPASLLDDSYGSTADAVAALQRDEVDYVFDEDVLLQSYKVSSLILTRVRAPDQPFAVAMAPGAHTLLDACDRAIEQFKESSANGSSWERAAKAHGLDYNTVPTALRRRILTAGKALPLRSPQSDDALQRVQRSRVLRVGVHPGVPGLCEEASSGKYVGLEPELAEYIGNAVFGEPGHVRFVKLHEQGLSATRSLYGRFVEPLLRLWVTLTTLGAMDWWSLGLAGRLPAFLAPHECVGKLDFVGCDYYWGTASFWPRRDEGLWAAMHFHYSSAPVWPSNIPLMTSRYQRLFPGKRIIIIENGCVPKADGYTRERYLSAHLKQIAAAIEAGAPIDGYLCWSITSNREWGLPFDGNSDFGLYHIDLDFDPTLTRIRTCAADVYAEIIRERNE